MPVLPEQVGDSQNRLVQIAGEIAGLLQDSKYDQAFPKFQSDGLPRQSWEEVMVRKLHRGCIGHCCLPEQGCEDRRGVWLLQPRHADRDPPRQTSSGRGNDSLRGSGPPLVQGRSFHVTHHAPVPVGTAHRALVPAMESASWRRLFTRAGLETGEIVVQRSLEAGLAADVEV